MAISIKQAIASAELVAIARGWRWDEPVSVRQVLAFLFYGPPMYEVLTNAGERGGNARFLVDLHDGTVREAYWHKR
jgi:hypothetical protein